MKESTAGLIYSKWTNKKQDDLKLVVTKSFLNGLSFVQNMISPSIQTFHSKFIYGQKMTVLHKGKLKQVSVYLDNLRDKLLWVSSQTKAFLIDLYFTNVYFRAEPTIQAMSRPNKKLHYFSLKQFEDEVIFVFQNQEEKKQYMPLFQIYIGQLRKIAPNYCIYFSNISKLHALHATQHGSNFITKQQIMDISSKAGLRNQSQNQDVLETCMKAHKLKDKNKISLQCVNDYFQIQFCSRRLQPIFEQFSKQKIGQVNKDPQAILKKVMSQQQFKTFLRDCQKQDETHIAKILETYKGQLSFFDFSLYLYDSKSNSINKHQKTPLDYPLKDYFCYSSHNTYLSGNQLSSDCKAERYSQDLQNGVKCVQLDVHNDGLKPIVTHAFKGTGLCKPVTFLQVIKAVQSFTNKCDLQKKPHFPIILSIENHASNQNREQMLDIMSRHFGKKIYYLNGDQTEFPHLGNLLGAILIKTNSKQEQVLGFKKKTLTKKLTDPISSNITSFQIKHSQKLFNNPELQQKYGKFLQLKHKLQNEKFQFNSRFNSYEQIFIPISSMAKITIIFKAQMGLHTVNPSSFVCTSLTNSKVQDTNSKQIVKYTIKSWLRTYPIATQINSYNYDPAPMLAVGAQIIALNTQTKDDFAWMMHRYFCGGHSTNLSHRGYLLKPLRLRNIIQYQAQQKKKHILTLRIIQNSGYDVGIKFRGLEQDNALNIEPGYETFTFKYYNPDESFIIFDIGEKYRDCVALRFISMGYRILQGRSKFSFIDSGVRILVYVDLKIQN